MVKQGGKKPHKNGRGRNPKEQKHENKIAQSPVSTAETVASHAIEPVGTAQALKTIVTEDGKIPPATTKKPKTVLEPVGTEQATEPIVTEDDTFKAQATA